MSQAYDAVLIVSFGGPEGPLQVLPFLENVTRGRGIPPERLKQVAKNYMLFGGVSPLNPLNRELRDLLEEELQSHGIDLPVFWGNRNWPPYLSDTVFEMKKKGVQRALAYVTSAFGSYSGCRQYQENIAVARRQAGEGAPEIDKIRLFFNHPVLIDLWATRVKEAFAELTPELRAKGRLVFTAHSLPSSMSESSPYVDQLRETARLVAEAASIGKWDLAYQSRSGPPTAPWLGPDILEGITALSAEGIPAVVVAPIGFLSDHIEILYDLDLQAKRHAEEKGMTYVRALTPGNDPAFVSLIRELIEERVRKGTPRRALGSLGVPPDQCLPDCCPSPEPAKRP